MNQKPLPARLEFVDLCETVQAAHEPSGRLISVPAFCYGGLAVTPQLRTNPDSGHYSLRSGRFVVTHIRSGAIACQILGGLNRVYRQMREILPLMDWTQSGETLRTSITPEIRRKLGVFL